MDINFLACLWTNHSELGLATQRNATSDRDVVISACVWVCSAICVCTAQNIGNRDAEPQSDSMHDKVAEHTQVTLFFFSNALDGIYFNST